MSSLDTGAVAIEPNTNLAMAFFDILDKNGRHDLFAIHPTLPKKAPGQTEAATFLPNDHGDLREWIDTEQGKRGVYVSPNRGRNDDAIDRRLSKADIGVIRAIYADIDPVKLKDGDASGQHFRDERVRLMTLAKQLRADANCPPTLIVDSGGGIQAWWMLAPHIPATLENVTLAEGIGRTLKARFGGDGVFDVSRVLRLPGTINIPNAEKAAQGRAPALATILVEESGDKRYTIGQVAEWAPPSAEHKTSNYRPKSPVNWDAVEADTYENLPVALREKFEAHCVQHPAVAELWDGVPAPWQNGLSASEFEFALASALKRSGIFTSTEFAQLHAVWDHRSTAHADDSERCAQRAWDNSPAPPTASGFRDESKNIAARREADKDALAEPADLWAERFTPADLPADVVPHVIECVARDQAMRLGVEAGACAAALLTAIGSLVPAGNQMQMRQHDPDWRVKPILWTALIGEPGTNKTAIVSYATRAAISLETKWAKEYAADRHAHDLTIATEQSPKAKAAAAKAAAPESPLSKSPEDWLDGAREPVMRRKIVQDATTEKLCEILSKNPDGLLFTADELAGLFGGMDAYRATAGKDRPLWLAAKEGGPYTVDRRSRDILRVENLAISVLGGIQPSKIKALGAGLAEDGMLQRFLMVMVKRHRIGEDVASNKKYAEALEQIAAAIVESERRGVFKFTPEGDREKRILEEFQQTEINRPGAPPALRQWLDKTPNEFGRLALVFHFIEWHGSPDSLSGDNLPVMVSGATARRARRFLMEFAYSHARVFHQSVIGGSSFAEHIAWIGGHILAHGLSVVTLRDIYRNYGPFKQAETRHSLLDIMQAMETEDWLIPLPGRHDNGRPTRWTVNSAVHVVFAAKAAEERAARLAAQNSIREEGAGRGERIAIEPETTRRSAASMQVPLTLSEMIG
jgi:hypothetical protein